MATETKTLNVSQVANMLGDLFRGPMLLPREVKVTIKNGIPTSIKGTVNINNPEPIAEMNGNKFPDEMVISAVKQFAILLQRVHTPACKPNLKHCNYVKDVGSSPSTSFIVEVKWGESYEELRTFSAYIAEENSFAAQVALSFYK